MQVSEKSSTFEHLPWLLFYVCANPPSGDLSGAALEVPSEALLHLVATFAKCSPYSHVARTFLKNRLRLLNQSLCHPYVSKLPTSSRETDSIDKSICFQKTSRFVCVCAFFVVPLSPKCKLPIDASHKSVNCVVVFLINNV